VQRRIAVLLGVAAREYLSELESLEAADLALAEEQVSELLDLFASDTITLVTALPLGGIRPPAAPVIADHLRLRELTPEEHGRLFEAASGNVGQPAPRRSVRPFTFSAASERVVLETRVRCDKKKQPQGALEPHRIVLALQLLGFELQGSGSATAWTEPGPAAAVGHPTISLAETGAARECTEDELRHAARLAEAIPQGAIWDPRTREDLVLHRFKLGVTERSPLDSLVDYVVALESFLLGEKEGEYRFKFGLFGGWYLGDNAEERERIAKDLREIYDVRSQIVHGAVPSGQRVAETGAIARDLTSRMIVNALENGWPAHDELRRDCYG
jgi:hypothetical protein